MAINLNLDEQQLAVQDTAREFFKKNSPPELARKYENSEEEFPRDLWRSMADMGWLGMAFPEEYDGLACSFMDMFPLYIEVGRALVPCPLLDVTAVAGALVAELGTDAQKQALLPAIAAGETIISSAVLEPDGSFGPEGIETTARREGDRYVLNGVKLLVSCVASAAKLVVAARLEGSKGEDGVTLFLVDPRAAGVTAERTKNIGGYPLYTVTFTNVAVAVADVLGDVGKAWTALHETSLKAAVLQAAMVVGGGERVLEMSVGYSKERVQFGVAIGQHQAVQYLNTDIVIHGRATKLLALHAAWLISSGQPFKREASLAKASASRASAAMTFAAHEVHAGIGFMIDYDLQLYTRRGKHWESNLGDHRYHMERAMLEAPAGDLF